MEEAECNRRGESKNLTVFRLFIIEFLSLYHTLKSSKTDVLLVFIWVQTVCKMYWQTKKFSTGMQRVITGKYFSVLYIIQYRIYMFMFTINIRTL